MPSTWSGSVRLDVTGNGTLYVSPAGRWQVTRTTVRTNQAATAVPIPRVDMYRSCVSDGSFLEGTYSGNLDISDTAHSFDPGEQMLLVWSGGIAGTIASATLAYSVV